jgi:hypothetical protein
MRRKILLVVSIVACSSPKPGPGRMPASGTMMAGDSMAMMALPLIPPAMAQLDSLQSPDSAMRALALSHHAETLVPLLRAIQTDLMHMGMHRDSSYEALLDSVRTETAAAGPLQPQLDRVRRLLLGYDAMVAKGKRG